MLYNGPDNYSVKVTRPFDSTCPNITLTVSSTAACLGNVPSDQIALPVNCSAIKGTNVLYNMNNIKPICPRDKNYETCLDHYRSLYIFSNLFSNNDISNSKCGDLSILASNLNLCTPGMNKIVQQYASTNDISQTFAKEIISTCKFDGSP